MNRTLLQVARTLHRSAGLRKLAKRFATGHTLTVPFHQGMICLDAVEHSWAWTGNRTLEDFELFLQERLIDLVRTRPHLIDIGCNVGVMSLSVLLRCPDATATMFDPNQRAVALLRESLRHNQLASRARVFPLAVSGDGSSVPFDPSGSFVGHVTAAGAAVPAIPLRDVIQPHGGRPCVIKIDVEGYETRLLPALQSLPAQRGTALVIELHPLGFNAMGDPAKVVAGLAARRDLSLSCIDGGPVDRVDPTQFTQLQALWPA